MPRKKSRTQRTAEFMKAAEAMYERMEDWYDAHPDASFEDIEEEMRRQRRGLMGGTLETLIVGRDSGFDVSRPSARSAGSRWSSKTIVRGRSRGWKGTAYSNGLTIPAPPAVSRVFPPLDRKLPAAA